MISEKPSLYLKPSGRKANSKLYLQKPEGTIGNMTSAGSSLGSRTNKDGFISWDSHPRFNYADSLTCPSLLLEPQRINLCLQYERFIDAVWIDNTQMTVTADAIDSPDGLRKADEIVYDSAGFTANGIVSQNITILNATEYTISIWLKGKRGGEKVQIDLRNSSSVGISGKERTLTTEWVRYDETLTSNSTTMGVQIRCLKENGDSTFFVWGSQLEEGDYATTLIGTATTPVTRTADKIHSGGDATTFNSPEGVFYTEIKALANDLTVRVLALSDGTLANRVSIQYSTTTNRIDASVYKASTPQAILFTTESTITEYHKIALKWKDSDFALWIDGKEVSVGFTGGSFSAGTLTEFAFDNGGGAGGFFYGECKEVRVYKTALTDTELEELTT